MAEVPKLAPPGSGLPVLDLWRNRLLFRLYRWKVSDEAALQFFAKEASKVTALFDSIPGGQQGKQVLVPAISGLEDSSRNWSASMVLEHLAIVNAAILGLLQALAAGHDSPEVSIAAVKPGGKEPEESLRMFNDSVLSYQEYLAAALPFNNSNTHHHPWFGPLSSHGWHCLAAVHHSIHKNQLKLIATNCQS